MSSSQISFASFIAISKILSEFTPDPGYTEENQEFVKFESFFEIVKSTETAEVEAQEQNEVQK